MEVYNILVLDEQEGYASRLKTELENRGGGDEIRVFWAKDAESINDITVNYTLNACVIGEAWRRKGGSFGDRKVLTLALYEERGQGVPQTALCRSDPVETTAQRILQVLKNRTRIVGVTGVGGGCGKTTVAMALAHHFALAGKRVFFLSLEPYMAASPLAQSAAVGLAEVFAAMDEPTGLEDVIARACSKPVYEGIDAFSVSEFNVDRIEADARDIRVLLNTMKRMNRWDVILVDLESRMDDRLFEVWQAASHMVMVIPHTQVALEKLKYVERELSFRQRRGEADLKKLVPALNFTVERMGTFKLFDAPVGIRIKNLNVNSATAELSSARWCEALRQKSGLELCRAIYEEVAR